MSSEEDKIVHIQGLTQSIKIEDIYKTYSKSGDIERIILGNGEALIFFSDDDEARSSLVYDTIGDLPIESEITAQTSLQNVIQDIDYIAKQKQEELLKAQRYEQEKQIEQKKYQDRLSAIQQQKQLEKEEAERQEQLLRDAAELAKKIEAEKIAQLVTPVVETIQEQVAQPEVHQPVPEVQPSQSYTPASPFKGSIDSSPSVEEVKVTQIPTPVIESPAVVNVEPPKNQQQEIFQESAENPSVAAETTPTVRASDVPQIAKEAIPSSYVPPAVNVQATTAPSFGTSSDDTVVSQPKEVKEQSQTSQDETKSNVSSSTTTTNSTAAAPTPSVATQAQPTQSACPFKSSCPTKSSNDSSSCTESSSTLDSVQLLKALKNTTLPERTVPSQNDIFKYIENRNFLIALFGILIAVTFSSAL